MCLYQVIIMGLFVAFIHYLSWFCVKKNVNLNKLFIFDRYILLKKSKQQNFLKVANKYVEKETTVDIKSLW